MEYRTYIVTRVADGAVMGTVDAQSAEQAVFRLFGGEWGRADYAATEKED